MAVAARPAGRWCFQRCAMMDFTALCLLRLRLCWLFMVVYGCLQVSIVFLKRLVIDDEDENDAAAAADDDDDGHCY